MLKSTGSNFFEQNCQTECVRRKDRTRFLGWPCVSITLQHNHCTQLRFVR